MSKQKLFYHPESDYYFYDDPKKVGNPYCELVDGLLFHELEAKKRGITPEEHTVNYREKAVDMAIARLKKHNWFRGVCTDTLPRFVSKENLEDVVKALIIDTEYYDNPDLLNTKGGTK